MMRKVLGTMALATGLIAGVSGTAEAGLSLTICDVTGATCDTIADGDVDDTALGANAIAFSGTVGSFNVLIDLAFGNSTGGPLASFLQNQISALHATGAPRTLSVEAIDDTFIFPGTGGARMNCQSSGTSVLGPGSSVTTSCTAGGTTTTLAAYDPIGAGGNETVSINIASTPFTISNKSVIVFGQPLAQVTQTTAVVPEPASLSLLGIGLAGLAGAARRRARRG